MLLRAVLERLLGWGLLGGFSLALVFAVALPIEMSRLADAREWPSRRAVILHSSITYEASARRPGRWEPRIKGRFLDDGETFWISRVRYGDLRLGEAHARRDAARYLVGNEVDVYFDPEDPRERILEPRAPSLQLRVAFACALAFLLAPLALYARGRRSREPEV